MKPAGDDDSAAAIDQIGGHFEEHTFFPFLEGLGFTPRAAIDVAMAAAADLKARIKRVKEEGNTAVLRVLLAAKYIQANLMTSGNNGEQVVKIFEDEALQPYAKIGQAIAPRLLP
jgi:hypothetical protein